jgi:hypothetical protein
MASNNQGARAVTKTVLKYQRAASGQATNAVASIMAAEANLKLLRYIPSRAQRQQEQLLRLCEQAQNTLKKFTTQLQCIEQGVSIILSTLPEDPPQLLMFVSPDEIIGEDDLESLLGGMDINDGPM